MKKQSLPELLSPAGNFEKMQSALRFGADAVYLSGVRFGMRAAADNFDLSELRLAVQYAHSLQKKVYLTLNVMPREHEIAELYRYIESLNGLELDAVIVADPGVFCAVKKYLPNVPVHVSTQAATVNADTCNFWYDFGAARVVLARELSLKDIEGIKKRIPDDLELEAFVHGSMCVSFSGRCMLSEYYTNRDANRGLCTQPCRWEYRFYEKKRPDDVLTCEIHPEGSYIFGSKDLSMINHVKDLIDVGINSFKIEGRMKSAYYAAVTANAYRIAIDQIDRYSNELSEQLNHELDSVSHREYCTGYFYDDPMKCSQLASDCGYVGEKTYLCIVESYDAENGLAKCKQKNKFYNGDHCEFITPGNIGESLNILDMFDESMEKISSCIHPQMTFYIKTDKMLKPGDIIRSK